MKTYQHILLATTLTNPSRLIALKAVQMAEDFAARLTLLHVVEKEVRGYKKINQARLQIEALGKELVVPRFDQHVAVGCAKTLIAKIAQQLPADLIILGGHGETAMAVSQTATCDIVFININKV